MMLQVVSSASDKTALTKKDMDYSCIVFKVNDVTKLNTLQPIYRPHPGKPVVESLIDRQVMVYLQNIDAYVLSL